MDKIELLKFIEEHYPNCSIAYRMMGKMHPLDTPLLMVECSDKPLIMDKPST